MEFYDFEGDENVRSTLNKSLSNVIKVITHIDADGIETVVFSKDAGPEWLAVENDGMLSGIPDDSDVGENTFTIRITDDQGLYDTAQMTIQVANVYSGANGVDDLIDFAAQWLMVDCIDSPACNGADLDGDADIDMSDLAELGQYWIDGRG